MTPLEILILFVIALVAGAIGQAIAGFPAHGMIGATVLGFVGALLGLWIPQGLGLPDLFVIRLGSETFPLGWSVVGAMIFVVLIRLMTFPARRRYV